MTRILIVVPIFLIAVAAMIGGIGLALPDTYSVRRSISIDAEPDAVFAELVNLEQWPNWYRDRADQEVLDSVTYGDERSGESAVQVWTEDELERRLEILEVTENERIDFVLTIGDEQRFEGTITLKRNEVAIEETEASDSADEGADDDPSEPESGDDDPDQENAANEDESDSQQPSAAETAEDDSEPELKVQTEITIELTSTLKNDPLARWTGLFKPSKEGKQYDFCLKALAEQFAPEETDADPDEGDANDVNPDDQTVDDQNADDANTSDDNTSNDDTTGDDTTDDDTTNDDTTDDDATDDNATDDDDASDGDNTDGDSSDNDVDQP